MPGAKAISLEFPSGGLNRRWPFQKQPPFTTPDCLNVWPTNVGNRRRTGGSRPGTVKAFATQLGSGADVNMLASVTWSTTSQATNTYQPVATGFDATVWTAVGADGFPSVLTAYPAWIPGGTGAASRIVGAKRNLTINTAASYDIKALIRGELISGVWYGGSYILLTDSTVLTVTVANWNTGAYTVSFVSGATNYSSSGTLAASYGGELVMTINGTNAKATLNGVNLLGAGGQTITAPAGTYIGFQLQNSNYTGSLYNNPQCFYLMYTGTAATAQLGGTLVAASNGQLYYENGSIMTAVGGATAVKTAKRLMAVERGQVLYIANFDPSTSAVAPVSYTPSTGTVANLTSTAGTMPTDCSMIGLFRDRLLLAGGRFWYMSRMGNPRDWDYTQLAAGDYGSAVYDQTTQTGTVGQDITAIATRTPDYVVFGCASSLWMLRGDPAYSGIIEQVSHTVGVLDRFAICRTPEDALVFLDRNGLWLFAPGSTSEPVSLSGEVLPSDLRDLDPNQVDVMLRFDPIFNGVVISLRNVSGDTSTHYFFDWKDRSFWPMQFPIAQDVVTAHYHSNSLRNGLMLGCSDGYIRKMDRTVYNDDGTNFDSYIIYGPLGSARTDLVLNTLTGNIVNGLGSVDWTVLTGQSHQQLINNPVIGATGTWTTTADGHGVNFTSRPRVRGASLALKLSNGADGTPWGIESVDAEIEVRGKARLGARA